MVPESDILLFLTPVFFILKTLTLFPPCNRMGTVSKHLRPSPAPCLFNTRIEYQTFCFKNTFHFKLEWIETSGQNSSLNLHYCLMGKLLRLYVGVSKYLFMRQGVFAQYDHLGMWAFISWLVCLLCLIVSLLRLFVSISKQSLFNYMRE